MRSARRTDIRSARRNFERLYGASPAHLLGALACFAVIAIAAMGWFVEPAISLKYILIWFGGAIVAGVVGLVFSPEILGKGDATYYVASGQHQHVYLGRYLVLVAVLFALSGLAYLRSRLTRRK